MTECLSTEITAKGSTVLGACVLSHFSRVLLFVTPWTVASQAPLFMGYSRQEYWNGYHSLLQGILPAQGSNPHLTLAGEFFITEPLKETFLGTEPQHK